MANTYTEFVYLKKVNTINLALFERVGRPNTAPTTRVTLVCIDRGDPGLRFYFDSNIATHQKFFNYSEPAELILNLAESPLLAGREYYAEITVYDDEQRPKIFSTKVSDTSLDTVFIKVVGTHESEGVAIQNPEQPAP